MAQRSCKFCIAVVVTCVQPLLELVEHDQEFFAASRLALHPLLANQLTKVGGIPATFRAEAGAMVTGTVQWPEGTEPTFVRILLAPPGAKRSLETETQIDGTERTYVWYEDAETLFVDEDGSIWKGAIRPGTYIAYWVDEKQVSHEVGRWTFEATKDYKVDIQMPKR